LPFERPYRSTGHGSREQDDAVMGCLTEAATGQVLDLFLGGREYVPPARVEFGLSLEGANPAGFVVEPADPAYARVGVANDLHHFPAAALSAGVKSNARPVVFPAPARDWGTVRSVFVAEPREHGGRVLLMCDFRLPRRVDARATAVRILAGDLAWR
jgi:hypothetical protein